MSKLDFAYKILHNYMEGDKLQLSQNTFKSIGYKFEFKKKHLNASHDKMTDSLTKHTWFDIIIA